MTKPDFSAAIFDMDGTVIDSMPYWHSLFSDYLEELGITPDNDDARALDKLTISQGAVYIKNRYCLEESVEKIKKDIEKAIDLIYTEQCTLKEGVKDYLEHLRSNGIPMGIATISDKKSAKKALKRLGVKKYFSFILTDTDVGKGKSEPDIYLAAAKKLRSLPENTAVFEDSFRYGKTAKKAGFKVYAVKDSCNLDKFEEFTAFADGQAPWQK